ncbi:MAG TPA: hypothetical protein VL727_27095 [Puia sp.]|jgi:hypothetical protein|nr:hypothetical protein [Puia sp.]
MTKRSLQSLLILLLVLPCHHSDGQGVRKFKGRLKILDGNKQQVINISVRLVDLGPGVTGSDGVFEIAINDNVRSVKLELVNSKWDIIYPIGGEIGVPQDPNLVTDFIIGDSPKELLTQAVAQLSNQLSKQLNALQAEQGIAQKGAEQAFAAILAEIQKKTDIKTEDLNNARDLDSKKDDFYRVLSAAINNYTNEAKDLKDAFKFSARHAFDDPQALMILTDAVNSYNEAFQDVNKKHNDYERTVNDLWKSDAKTIEIREFFNYALGELHSSNIFVLNLKIRDINDYNRGSYPGSKKGFKELVLRDIETSILQLERRLQELDTRAQLVLSKLIT